MRRSPGQSPGASLDPSRLEAYELWPELHIFEDAAATSQGSFMPRTLETDFNEINQFRRRRHHRNGERTTTPPEEAADYAL